MVARRKIAPALLATAFVLMTAAAATSPVPPFPLEQTAGAPAPPADPALQTDGNGVITLSWTHSTTSGLDAYVVYWWTPTLGWDWQTVDETDTSFTVPPESSPTLRGATVTAVKGGVESRPDSIAFMDDIKYPRCTWLHVNPWQPDANVEPRCLLP